jgi:hypothetical protein
MSIQFLMSDFLMSDVLYQLYSLLMSNIGFRFPDYLLFLTTGSPKKSDIKRCTIINCSQTQCKPQPVKFNNFIDGFKSLVFPYLGIVNS